MGQRLRALAILVVLLGVGVLLGSALSQWWRIGPQLPARPHSSQIPGRIRVEVLNAGGTPGLARDATTLLRDLGLDVVYYGNAENFTGDSSVVLDRVEWPEAARAVAEALGILEVSSQPDSTLFVDVTVRLGPEWSVEQRAEEGEEGALRWWDPRRFFRNGEAGGDPDSTGP